MSTSFSHNALVLGCWQSLKGDLCLSELRFWFSCWVFLITAVSMLSNRHSSSLDENANNTKQLLTTGNKTEGKKTRIKNFLGISVPCGMQVLNWTKCLKLIRMPAVMLGTYAPWPLYCTSHFNNFSDNEGCAMLVFKCWVMWYLDIRERKPFLLTHKKKICTNRKLFSSKKTQNKTAPQTLPLPWVFSCEQYKMAGFVLYTGSGKGINVMLLSEWKTEYWWKMLAFHPLLMNKNSIVTFIKHS